MDNSRKKSSISMEATDLSNDSECNETDSDSSYDTIDVWDADADSVWEPLQVEYIDSFRNDDESLESFLASSGDEEDEISFVEEDGNSDESDAFSVYSEHEQSDAGDENSHTS